GEIHDPRAAGPKGDQEIYRPLPCAAGYLARSPRGGVEPHPGIAIAVHEAINMLEQVGPYRLRAGIAAPSAPHSARNQEQADAGHDQQSGHEIEFVRPYLDVEHVEPAIDEINQHSLIGRIGPPIPADPWRAVIDRQRDRHDQPLEAAEGPVDPLVVDLLALFEQLLGQMLPRRFV